jgi:hypothetical protein
MHIHVFAFFEEGAMLISIQFVELTVVSLASITVFSIISL